MAGIAYLHIRDSEGNILEEYYSPGQISKVNGPRTTVPSLGDSIDFYLDSHGFPTPFLLQLYTGYALANDIQQFAGMLRETLSMAEVE